MDCEMQMATIKTGFRNTYGNKGIVIDDEWCCVIHFRKVLFFQDCSRKTQASFS